MNPSKNKGSRFEREIVDAAKTHWLESYRVPLSGSVEGYPGDVVIIDGKDERWTVEAKKRADGFKTLYGWLDNEAIDCLVIGADRAPPLAVLPLGDFLQLLAERIK